MSRACSVGSSPRLRGTPHRLQGRAATRRFIPAPAGNTAAISRSKRVRPVHPRACGEHCPGPPASMLGFGSSPRLRGTLGRILVFALGRRFIPAPAGNTPTRSMSASMAAVHPRACGEHELRRWGGAPYGGSSPRLRGTLRRRKRREVARRFIPAPAGNTAAGVVTISTAAVHPRACGEHPRSFRSTMASSGSSPRLRGTPALVTMFGLDHRFIPAPAGNTSSVLFASTPAAVHPRACGEHRQGRGRIDPKAGSSPRLRGTRALQPEQHRRIRFIPAPAGNTVEHRNRYSTPAVHPRACGEHAANERSA